MSADAPVAIIDIGSNSVRLVVYDRTGRAPSILFNEKVTAGLGNRLDGDGALAPDAVAIALRGIARFKAIADAMAVQQLRAVATAAVRDASNGEAFIDAVAQLGVEVELLSGDDEARFAGLGVIAAIPRADGIVGDLGGGSLELVRVRDGAILDRASFPLGVLRIAGIREKGRGALDRHVAKLLAKGGWKGVERDLPFYLVGGSWRSLARLHMHLIEYPLPILHQYIMPPQAGVRLARAVARIDRRQLKAIEALSAARVPALADAAALLATLTRALKPKSLVVSAFGLREGLLYAALSHARRAEDPLIVATRAAGARQGRFAEHGDLLASWIAPIFAGDAADDRRLRHAACLLGDVGWAASPEFRAERGVDIALHGNWVGIDARGRAMIAQALCTSFAGGDDVLSAVRSLASPEDFARATRWGAAIRFGQRLSGGVARPLTQTALKIDDTRLVLTLAIEAQGLYGETVERRHRQLAQLLGLDPGIA